MLRKLTFLLLTSMAFSVAARKTSINHDWEFQRLNTAAAGAIRNQGNDWSSQYDVEHVSSAANTLSMHPDTLKTEMALLESNSWEPATLPHTPFIEDLTVLHQWQGICYYRKKLEIEPEMAGKRLWLEFGGAMHLADLWINGRHAAQHSGGYLPFAIDATDFLKAGEKNEILVRLDNRNNPLIPPGKPLENLDFCYYGGLHRGATLTVKPDIHISNPSMADIVAGGGVFVSFPKVSEEKAIVEVKTHIANAGKENADGVSMVSSLHEWDSKKGIGKKIASVSSSPLSVKSGKTAETIQQIEVASPKLWSPDSPALYMLVSELKKNGKTIDTEKTRIGIRRIEFTKEKGFMINGTPLELVGTNRHSEYPYVGNALPPSAQFRDIHQIRSNGFNIVRLGHYPQDPSVLDACDELGLLVIEPIPGWQFFNNNEAFIAHTYSDIRQLIRRDRNHPSIVMWETTLNESWPPKEWKDGAVKTAHEEYPGDQCYTSGDSYGYDGFDVCYNDWQEGFHRPATTSKPAFIREYYDYEFGGHNSTTRIGRKDGNKALQTNAWNAQWSFNRYKADYPATSGSAVWSMYDYNRGCCDNICASGTADIFRLPKYSLQFFRSQIAPGSPTPEGPMPEEVFIAAISVGISPVDTIQVYGNVDEVELFRNGVSISRKRADNGADSDYIPSPDGGNCRNLAYPPFTFSGVDWTDGSLEAVGYRNGKRVASHKVTVPGEAAALEISYFQSGREASGDDLLIVYVTLTDKDGNPLTHVNGRAVALETDGANAIQGPAESSSEAGTASFLVRTGKDSRKLKLRATSGPLSSATTITLKKTPPSNQ